MKENEFNKKVGIELKKHHCFFHKVVDRTTAGIPDIIICMNGNFVGLELKVDKRPLTHIQTFYKVAIRAAGGLYYVMRYLNSDSYVQVEHMVTSFHSIHKYPSIPRAIGALLDDICAR